MQEQWTSSITPSRLAQTWTLGALACTSILILFTLKPILVSACLLLGLNWQARQWMARQYSQSDNRLWRQIRLQNKLNSAPFQASLNSKSAVLCTLFSSSGVRYEGWVERYEISPWFIRMRLAPSVRTEIKARPGFNIVQLYPILCNLRKRFVRQQIIIWRDQIDDYSWWYFNRCLGSG